MERLNKYEMQLEGNGPLKEADDGSAEQTASQAASALAKKRWG